MRTHFYFQKLTNLKRKDDLPELWRKEARIPAYGMIVGLDGAIQSTKTSRGIW